MAIASAPPPKSDLEIEAGKEDEVYELQFGV